MERYIAKWQKHYDTLCDRAINRTIEGYTEKHHIIPRCMGGSNDTWNLVRLTAREHLIAHMILTKMYPDNCGLSMAVKRLIHDKRGRTHNSRSFEWVRRNNAQLQSAQRTGQTKENCLRVAKMAEKQRGKTQENNEGTRRGY